MDSADSSRLSLSTRRRGWRRIGPNTIVAVGSAQAGSVSGVSVVASARSNGAPGTLKSGPLEAISEGSVAIVSDPAAPVAACEFVALAALWPRAGRITVLVKPFRLSGPA
jgi:hypothetical protein